MLTFQEDWISQMGSDSYPQILGIRFSSYKAISITWLSDFLIDWQTDKTDRTDVTKVNMICTAWYEPAPGISCELWTIIFKMLTLSSRWQEAMANLVTPHNIKGKKKLLCIF